MAHLDLSRERLTLVEAAAECGLKPHTVRRWIKLGLQGRTLPAYRIGGRWFVLRTELYDFLKDAAPPRHVFTLTPDVLWHQHRLDHRPLAEEGGDQ
jgi:hypothetical protein